MEVLRAWNFIRLQRWCGVAASVLQTVFSEHFLETFAQLFGSPVTFSQVFHGFLVFAPMPKHDRSDENQNPGDQWQDVAVENRVGFHRAAVWGAEKIAEIERASQ